MLSSIRSHGLHRRTHPRACWLWGDQQQQARPPASPPLARPPTPSAPQLPPVAVQAVAEQQPAEAEVIILQPTQPQVVPQVSQPPKPLTRSFFDVLKFNGPGPELINGRLAMIGILAVAKGELDTGATVLQQAATASPWAYAGLLLWVYASLVPMFKGARHEAFGIFTPQAEILNGRAAMLGFGILLALEYKAGVPFF